MLRIGKNEGAVVVEIKNLGTHGEQFGCGLGDGSGRRTHGKTDRLLRVGIQSKKGLNLFAGSGLRVFFSPCHLPIAITGDAMRINGQDLSRIVPQGLAEFSQHQLGALGFAHGMSVQQFMDSAVTGYERQSVGRLEALLTEGAIVAFTRNAQGGFMNQLQGYPWLNTAGLFAAPATKQVPGSQTQMFRSKQPDTDEVAGDFVAEQLAELTLDGVLITGFNPTGRLCPLGLDAGRIWRGERKVEFFFGARTLR